MNELKQRASHQRIGYIVHIIACLTILVTKQDNAVIQVVLFLGVFILTFGGTAYVYKIETEKDFMNHSRRISIPEWYRYGNKWVIAAFLIILATYIVVCNFDYKMEKYQAGMMLFITLDAFMMSMLDAITNRDIHNNNLSYHDK